MKVRSRILSPSVARGLAAVCAAVFVTSVRTAQAGINVWTSHGPEGAQVAALAIDPTMPSTLYAASQGIGSLFEIGVFKSTDGATSWQAAGLPSAGFVGVFAIDSSTPTTLYAGTNGGVFKSTDGATSWQAVNTGLPDNTNVQSLAIDPTASRTLYAGTFSGGVFKSTDGGGTWNPLNTGLTATWVFGLIIDLTTPGTLYAATADGGVFDIEQVSACVGDCGGTDTVAINDLITLVNIALGTAQPSACPNGGLPIGGQVDVAVIIRAVNSALSGCGEKMRGRADPTRRRMAFSTRTSTTEEPSLS